MLVEFFSAENECLDSLVISIDLIECWTALSPYSRTALVMICEVKIPSILAQFR